VCKHRPRQRQIHNEVTAQSITIRDNRLVITPRLYDLQPIRVAHGGNLHWFAGNALASLRFITSRSLPVPLRRSRTAFVLAPLTAT
jgi:hypothetical protein